MSTMLRLVLVALTIFQVSVAVPISSINSVAVASSYSNNPNGDSSNTVLCGSLTCPETTDTCVVTQISSDDLTTITTTRECRLGNKVLLSSATVEPNKYQVRVNNVASSGIGKPTAEDAQRTNEMVQAVFAHTNQVQNAIQNQIQANLANLPYFRYSKINKK